MRQPFPFSLEDEPIEDSIQVLVDGEPQTTWTYESDRNAVFFAENPPTLGNSVRILYDYYFD